MAYKKTLKRYARQTTGVAKTTVFASGLSLGLGAIGGTSAINGQQALQNATKYAPAMGSMIGAGATISLLGDTLPQKKKRRR